MNAESLKGKWTQLKGEVRRKWGMLTDDDVDVIAGERDKLLGKVQERYGYAKERAEKAVDEWIDGLEGSPPPRPENRPPR